MVPASTNPVNGPSPTVSTVQTEEGVLKAATYLYDAHAGTASRLDHVPCVCVCVCVWLHVRVRLSARVHYVSVHRPHHPPHGVNVLPFDACRGRSELQRELKSLRQLLAGDGDANVTSSRHTDSAQPNGHDVDYPKSKKQMNGRSRRNNAANAKSDESDHEVDDEDHDRNSASSLQRLSSSAYGPAYGSGDQSTKLNNGGVVNRGSQSTYVHLTFASTHTERIY